MIPGLIHNAAELLTKGGFAARKHVTPAQIALAWLLVQKPWILPIPGINKLEYLKENLASVDVVLTPEDLREIDSAAAKIEVSGARLGEGAPAKPLAWSAFGLIVGRRSVSGYPRSSPWSRMPGPTLGVCQDG